MRSSRPQRFSAIDTAPQSEQIEDLLRFAHSLEAHSDPERLLCSLPAELRSLVMSNTTALIHRNGSGVTMYAVDNEGSAIDSELEISQIGDEIWQLPVRLHGTRLFAARSGEQILWHRPVLPQTWEPISLRASSEESTWTPRGCMFRKKQYDGFSKQEIGFLSLIADYVALAIDDRVNLAHSKAAQVQLESEQTKLKLILDLNNSVVSNLELREVLRRVSPSIRKTMRLDA